MKTSSWRTQRVSLLAALLLLHPTAVAAPPDPSPPSASAQQDAARLFELGLAWLEQHRFAEAVQAFELAYRLAPHPDVLYNIALVQLELARLDAAEASLRQLLESVPADDVARRSEAQRLLDSIATRREEAKPPELPAPSSSSPVTPVHEARPNRPTSSNNTAHSMTQPSLLSDAQQPKQRDLTLPVAFAAVGVALMGGGFALWWWNDDRYEGAMSRRSQLTTTAPDQRITDREQLATVLTYERELSATRATLDTVAPVDWVALSSVAVGALCAGAGVYFYATGPTTSLTVSARGMAWRATW